MITQGQPLYEEGTFDTMGMPFHGLFKDGGLLLPNGQRKTFPPTKEDQEIGLDYPSPVNLNIHRPGDVSVVRVPGHVLQRQPEDTAQDAVKGHQWFDYGVISGPERYIYGSRLGARSWLYAVAVGEIYLIEMAQQPISGILTFKVSRFGDLSGTPNPKRIVNVPFPSAASLGFTNERFEILFLELCGHSSDGKKAAVGLGLTLSNATLYDRQAPYPEAFVSVTISGAGGVDNVSIAVSTYLTASGAIKFSQPATNLAFDTRVIQTYVPVLYFSDYTCTGASWSSRKITGAMEVMKGSGNDPAAIGNPCGGSTVPGGQALSFSNVAVYLSGERGYKTEAVSNRIIWVFVDALGSFTNVEAELYYKYTQVIDRYENGSATASFGGFDYNAGGIVTRQPSGAMTTHTERFYGTETILELRLKLGGGLVDTWRSVMKTGSVDKQTYTETLDAASLTLNRVGSTSSTDKSTEVGNGYNVDEKSVAFGNISSKCAPNPNELVMGYAPNWYVNDGEGQWYWPYVYLYSNGLVGIIEGHAPEKTTVTGGYYYTVYLTTAGDPGGNVKAALNK